jgi:glutathione peroxidase
MNSIYELPVTTIDGVSKTVADFSNKTLLIVNVASKCGFTPQYEGLEKIYRRYKDSGFEILGFPCDQFGHQEPGDDQEIKNFCSLTYEVSFPMFKKIKVNGGETAPLFQFLKQKAPGIFGTEAIKWNFTKFLVDRNGQVLKRYSPREAPESLSGDIEVALKA